MCDAWRANPHVTVIFPTVSSSPPRPSPSCLVAFRGRSPAGGRRQDPYAFPVNPSPRDLRQKSLATCFPFDEITDSVVKLKEVPIQFSWRTRKSSPESHVRRSPENRARTPNWAAYSASPPRLQVGRGSQTRWFMKPPKIQIVPGLVGKNPFNPPCGKHLENARGGEGNSQGDPESGHLPQPFSETIPTQSSLPNPNPLKFL